MNFFYYPVTIILIAENRNIVGRNMLSAFGHRVVMCCDMLGVVGSSLKMVKFEPTCRNMVAKGTQHVAFNNVAICCVGMLRSCGRGFGLCWVIKTTL